MPYEPSPKIGHLGGVLLLFSLSLVLFWSPLAALLELSLADDRYSHIAFVPFIVAAFLYLESARIFRSPRYSPRLGGSLLLATALLYFTPAPPILALVLLWIAAFLLCYGPQCLAAARFPALFLLLMVPLPVRLVDGISYGLQVASSDLTYALFRLIGIPVYRHGFVFSLPNVTIQVAEQCSGIRSTIALTITAILLGHLFLRSGWTKLALVALAAFVAVFKNAIRIVFLSSAGAWFHTDLLNSSLHHKYGGTVFSLVALAMIVPALLLFRRAERGSPV